MNEGLRIIKLDHTQLGRLICILLVCNHGCLWLLIRELEQAQPRSSEPDIFVLSSLSICVLFSYLSDNLFSMSVFRLTEELGEWDMSQGHKLLLLLLHRVLTRCLVDEILCAPFHAN